jgi:hypothetical protein
MQTDFNASQRQNAEYPIRVSFEPDSNVNDDRDEQFRKQFLAITSTDDGMQNDCNPAQPSNA